MDPDNRYFGTKGLRSSWDWPCWLRRWSTRMARLRSWQHQTRCLSILDSTRPNVLPDIVDRVAALGPEAIPHLIEMLESDNVWAWLRALRVVQKIARQQPGMADRSVPAILESYSSGAE